MIFKRRHDPYEDDSPEPRAQTHCRCFAPGEVGGTCPGPANCPLCQDSDDEDFADTQPAVRTCCGAAVVDSESSSGGHSRS